MSRRSWIVWTTLGVVGAAICAVVYYRAGGETTGPFVAAMIFTVVWIPTQVWISRKTNQTAERIRQRRHGAS